MKTSKLLKNTIAVLFVLYCFYSYGLQPFFTWETFWDGKLGYIGEVSFRTIIGLLIIIVSLIVFVRRNQKFNKQDFTLAVWCLATTGIGILFSGFEHFFSLEWIIFLVFFCFMLSSDELKAKSYYLFYNIFVIALIVPIIVYILVHIGIHVPYTEIKAFEQMKTNQWIYYKIYPLASQWASPYQETYCALRLCGIYNESGVVGTYAALLLCIEKFKLKDNWKNVVLLIGGILSFSLAFYLIVFIYFTIKAAKLNTKYLFLIISVVCLYFVFMNVSFENEALTRLQARFTITSYGLQGNNRTSESYDQLFNSFIAEGGTNLLFGYGHGEIEKVMEERLINGSSYKNLIYNYGIVGFFNQILWMLAFPFIYRRKTHNNSSLFYALTCVSVFIASFYQRPAMFALQYMLPLVGGVVYHTMTINQNSSEKKMRGVLSASNKIRISTTRR